MILEKRPTTNPGRRRRRCFPLAGIGLLLVLPLLSCGEESNGVDPSQRLCGGEAGLGAEVQGGAAPLEFCVDDANVSVVLTTLDRYDIAAQIDSPAGVLLIRMVFALRSDFPVSLVPVDTIYEATANSNAVWIYYEEAPDGGEAIGSLEVTGGSFHLGFSDENVLAGTFEDVTLTMHGVSTGDEVGTRRLSEGFFSLSVKDPTAMANFR